MLISLDWLKDFVDLPANTDPQELGTLLTLKTAEVEKVESESAQFDNMVAGLVLSISKHPDADKLQVAKVSIGKETSQIVCGGANLKEGMYVAVTKPGSFVRWHGEGDLIELKTTKVRGVESEGMIAASCELGIDNPEEGEEDIMDLSAIKPEPGTPLAEIFQKNDTIFEFDNKSLTHRPDLWGHHGIAREVAALTGGKFKKLEPKVKIPTKGESPKVEIKDFKLCPRYCGLIINNITVEESPDWLKKRLKATGHGTHSNIVDITNYVMHELGQPLHAFDKSYIEGGIIVRTATDKEKITTLDNKKRELSSEMLVIADHKKPVAIAGVMGGENSEINEKTTSIIIESANFHASNIRKTATKLGLRTDAVQRFEKSLDPLLAELALLRAAELILKVCPNAEIAGPITDVKKFSEKTLEISFDTEKAASKIGAKISSAEMKKFLESLEFEVSGTGKTLKVKVPSFRATKDVAIEDDLVEEVARMYGYDNLAPELPPLPINLPRENTERFKKHRARELFSYGLGFDEIKGYSFYSKTDLENCLMTEEAHLKVLNFLSEDQTHMRTHMTPSILKALQVNVKNFPELRIYEVGRTYLEIGEFMPLEEKIIAGAVMIKGESDEPFYEVKGAVEAFLSKFKIKTKFSQGTEALPYAHPTKSASFLAKNGDSIAKIAMLHPTVQKNHDLKGHSIAFFEINFTEALKLENPDYKFTALPKFPSILLDISVLVDENIEITKIANAIKQANTNLIKNVELFDIYQGEGIPEGKKAVAFKIETQAPDRTLTDPEMNEIKNKIFKNLEALGGKIRGA
ncbi:phenylalanine--tRNA ligase subunit beta [Candidatus Gracilibacteria bacterium]|nr:phenylalanine--tRNA ligase subunit beta [Candidatus Gracilibacteria bacterium]